MTEAEIRDLVARNIKLLDPHWTVVECEHTIKDKDGEGRIDILARDEFGCFAAIEIKKSDQSARSAAHQVFKYSRLLKKKYRLNSSDIVCMIISTEWDELALSFGEYASFTDFECKGYKCIITGQEEIGFEEVQIPVVEGGNQALHNFIFFEFTDAATRDRSLAELEKLLQATPSLNSILVSCDYKGTDPAIIHKFGYSWTVLKGDALALEDELEILSLPVNCTDFDWILQDWENGTVEAQIRSHIVRAKSLDKRREEPAGFALHSLNNILKQWEHTPPKAIGQMFDLFNENELITMACGFHGGHPYNFVAKVSKDRSKHLGFIQKNLNSFLSNNSRWQVAVNEVFRALPDSATLEITIYNPMNILGAFNDLYRDQETHRLPMLEIIQTLNGEETAFIGQLSWFKKSKKIPLSRIISQSYTSENVFRLRQYNQWVTQYDEKLSTLLGLRYEVENTTSGERLDLSEDSPYWKRPASNLGVRDYLSENQKIVRDVGEYFEKNGI